MRRGWLGSLLGAALVLGAAPSSAPSPGASSVPVPSERPIDLTATISLSQPAFVSAAAFADSLETGIRLVRVRILDRVDTRIELRSTGGIALAEAPSLCLYWRDAAPDDAGLESPCWGDPDQSETLELLGGPDGSFELGAGESIVVTGSLSRGARRCDYPPGEWILRVTLRPRVDGVVGEPVYVRTPFEVPYDPAEVVPALSLGETRFCGLASEVVVEQGVPPTAQP
jgi:hypothetical protein